MAIDTIAQGIGLTALKKNILTNNLTLANQNAQRSSFPVLYPAAVTTPTVTLNTSAPVTAPQQRAASSGGVLSTHRYTFIKGKHVPNPTGSATSGYIQQGPITTMGYGSAFVETLCDAPYVAIAHSRANSAVTRVMVDNLDGLGFKEAFRVTGGIRRNTAQAGGASTITLDSGASATNNQYLQNWVYIASGTGAGQFRQITGYVGSTKVATVGQAWSVNPDNTSVFELSDTKAQFTNLTNTGVSVYYIQMDWSGERRLRHYRIEHGGQGFSGLYVPSITDVIIAAPRKQVMACVWGGDSFGAGTGTDMGGIGSMARVACDYLGFDHISMSIGGTGIMATTSGTALNLADRILPPDNAWFVDATFATGGSFTVTQNGITATINQSDSASTVQTKINTAFGAGKYAAIFGQAGQNYFYWFVGQGSYANDTNPMTADFSSLTGASGTATISRYYGSMDSRLPKDSNGAPLPFLYVTAVAHNDVPSVDAGQTASAVEAAMTAHLTKFQAKYPMAIIIVIGIMFVPGSGVIASEVVNVNNAMLNAATAALPLINGRVPFINTISPNWFPGSGKINGQVGDGSSDFVTWTDGVHPSTAGHIAYGLGLATEIQDILQPGSNPL